MRLLTTPRRAALGLGALALSAPALAQDDAAAQLLELNAKLDVLYAELDDLRTAQDAGTGDADRLWAGGYGEVHANLADDGKKFADPHRFVIYLGYDFGGGISLHSETELEHGFVKDGDGEVSLEQLYAEIDTGATSGVRFGRLLNPLGIINQRHEPSTFSGVERPNLEKYLIPSTWSQDGIGVFGTAGDELTWELQLTSGLDGSGFDSKDGIRGGRMKERPGLGDPAISGRLDWRPELGPDAPALRLGGSFYSGGADNGDQGNDPGVDARVDILALDFEAGHGPLDLRGVLVQSRVTGAEELNAAFGNDVGEEQVGWYLQADLHLLDLFGDREPSADARFPEQDLVAFVRLEEYDTQDVLAPGSTDDPTSDREETTIGIGWWPVPDFVLKVDFQDLDDATGDRDDQWNLGVGWTLLP